MKEENYTIWIEKKPIAVTEEVYREYWKGKRKERYFSESDIHNQVMYYNALDTEETNGIDIFCNEEALSVEDEVIKELEIIKLKGILHELSPEEYDLIERLYYYNQSLRQISKEKQIPLSTLHYRHLRILNKLKILMER